MEQEKLTKDQLAVEPLKFAQWQPIDEALPMLRERFMTHNPEFVLRNWDCKYINARIDMRTGNVILTPGNVHE